MAASYLTLAELDTYMNKVRASFERDRISWSSLSPEDKQNFMDRATNFFHSDKFKWQGWTLTDYQELKFPRLIEFGLMTGIPEELKLCIADLTYWIIYESQSTRFQMIQAGVKGIKGKMQEDYDSSIAIARKENLVHEYMGNLMQKIVFMGY